MSSDTAAFIRAICDNPDNDTIRLAFADYLDESGDPIDAVRAEFIRCSLGEAGGDTAAKACGNSLRLKARAAELLEEHEANWLVDWPGWEIGWKANSTWVPEAHWMWDRGFVSRVEMPVDAFYRWSCDCSRTARPSRRFGKLANPVCDRCGAVGTISGCAAELFRLMPVIEVLFTDREPSRYDFNYFWFDDRRDEGVETGPPYLPAAIYDRLDWKFNIGPTLSAVLSSSLLTLGDAYRCVGDAAVSIGRELAGLPQLKGK